MSNKANIRKNYSEIILDNIMMPEMARKSLKDNFSFPILVFWGFGWLFTFLGFGFNIYIMVTAATWHGWNFYLSLVTALAIAFFISYSVSIGTLRSQKTIRIYKEDAKDGKIDNKVNYRYAFLFSTIAIIAVVGSICIQLFMASDSSKQRTGVLSAGQKIEHLLKVDSIATARESEAAAREKEKKNKIDQEYLRKLNSNPEAATVLAKITSAKADSSRRMAAQNKTIKNKTKWSKDYKFSRVKRAEFVKDIEYRNKTIIPKIQSNHNSKMMDLKKELLAVTQHTKDWREEQHSIVSSVSGASVIREKLTQYHDDLISEQETKAIVNTWITKGAACVFDIVSFLIFSFFGRRMIIDFTTHDIYSNTSTKKSDLKKQTPKANTKRKRGLFTFFKPAPDTNIQQPKSQQNQQQQQLEEQQEGIKQKEYVPRAPRFDQQSKAEQERLRGIYQRSRGQSGGDEPTSIPLELDDHTEQYLKRKELRNTPPTPTFEVLKNATHYDTVTQNDTKLKSDTVTQNDTVEFPTELFNAKNAKKAARTNFQRHHDLLEIVKKEKDITAKEAIQQKAEKAKLAANKHIQRLQENRHIVTIIPQTGKLKIDQVA